MRTVKEQTFGKTMVRLLQRADGTYAGVTLTAGKMSQPLTGTDLDELWSRLCREVGASSPAYFGYEGARARFLAMFPGGFGSAAYTGRERQYKLDAKALLDEIMPLEAAGSATAEDAQRVMRAFSATNMLSQFELMRMKDVLTSPRRADFVRGAAALAHGDVDGGFRMMVAAASHAIERLSWPMATYLPFLWRPAEQMYLKPEATRDFAERVGHGFAYSYDAALEAKVYRSLLDLVAETEREIADLGPADRIDVQSFIWVVGKYEDADASVPEPT